jgi:hypothetical protein
MAEFSVDVVLAVTGAADLDRDCSSIESWPGIFAASRAGNTLEGILFDPLVAPRIVGKVLDTGVLPHPVPDDNNGAFFGRKLIVVHLLVLKLYDCRSLLRDLCDFEAAVGRMLPAPADRLPRVAVVECTLTGVDPGIVGDRAVAERKLCVLRFAELTDDLIVRCELEGQRAAPSDFPSCVLAPAIAIPKLGRLGRTTFSKTDLEEVLVLIPVQGIADSDLR